MINIVGLGPGSTESLTIGALQMLKSGEKVLLRTRKHPTVEYLDSENISYDTFDSIYDKGKSFDLVYDEIVTEIIKQQELFQDIVYAVPGNPLVAESTVTKLIKRCKEESITYRIFPAVSFIDSVMETIEIDPINGLKILDAFDIKNHVLDKRCALLITQVYDRFIASEVKLNLLQYYKDETDIYFIKAASVKDKEIVRKIKLYQLDRQTDTDYLTSVYIPKDINNRYDFRSLTDIIGILRGDNGCPWDREQTHESLKRCLIEESYEVIEAIDNKDEAALQEELGDLLLQVVMHAQIGEEEGYFDINDVVEGICKKMVERHPHVFGDINLKNSNEVLVNWDKIKNKQQGISTYTEGLKHVAKCLPGLMRAEKIQKKAAKVGFDWDSVNMAIIKAEEEITEIKQAIFKGDKENMKEEIGDLIFSAVNIARFLDIDPENAVNYTIEKFIKRFQFIEEKGLEAGKNLMDMSLKEMDALWEKSKIK
ncbi:MAG: nucleoside triphosphate pyrophosphohydrolase [Clostridiaceae bacterium]